jgi:hypothetical protein
VRRFFCEPLTSRKKFAEVAFPQAGDRGYGKEVPDRIVFTLPTEPKLAFQKISISQRRRFPPIFIRRCGRSVSALDRTSGHRIERRVTGSNVVRMNWHQSESGRSDTLRMVGTGAEVRWCLAVPCFCSQAPCHAKHRLISSPACVCPDVSSLYCWNTRAPAFRPVRSTSGTPVLEPTLCTACRLLPEAYPDNVQLYPSCAVLEALCVP